MNLVDALRTARPLRRPIAKHLGSNGDGWLSNSWVMAKLTTLKDEWYVTTVWIDETDLLADDWEVKYPSVTLTIREFWGAFHDALNACGTDRCRTDTMSIGNVVNKMARSLGLEQP